MLSVNLGENIFIRESTFDNVISIIFCTCRYERLLKRARTEDLASIACLRCLYRTGQDRFGRPVIVFVGKHFPASSVDLDMVGIDNSMNDTSIRQVCIAMLKQHCLVILCHFCITII